ncbi:AraC family transcriptional regulator [Siphonobacter sp. BAB-5385]|uniref:helix-turn-helix domain-containing protein n=1 Tax=unclassified Siphonobacter TaxID=2635712 RepID=UPI000B9E128F|nr:MULTISPECIES: AraC family transcriptional regulator [unclassified Siphonobacter]OZI05510.1 AraC family transcriptional regulator [Siphonobacter sp. BAB-5385]PMD87153.1 AraC family transcriptional regulator [Siphonobacter sp. BAB-5405]
METIGIPRVELETFAAEEYKIPLWQVEHYPVHSSYFIVENRDEYPVKDYISPHRRKFYKIFHMTSGTGTLTIGLHRYAMGPDEIAFVHPDEIMSWQTTSEETGGHFCLIHPDYFGHDADHVLQLLRQFSYFQADQAVVQLEDRQSLVIDNCFATMLTEDRADAEDKKQAILLQLQLVLLESKRAGKNRAQRPVSDSYGYIYRFLALLESSFQVQSPDDSVQLKTAAEFAEQLHVHPNYLNALIKNHTGKTLREHIQDRLLHEAKALLVQTDWDINQISDGLGFSGQAAFTAFFRKKVNVSPSLFRKNSLRANQPLLQIIP